jgi:hypothetical protein
MIVLDAAPSIVRVRGAPIIFHSPDETVDYARLHNVQQWMVYGDPDGWWPIYTQDGPLNPLQSPKPASISACTANPHGTHRKRRTTGRLRTDTDRRRKPWPDSPTSFWCRRSPPS